MFSASLSFVPNSDTTTSLAPGGWRSMTRLPIATTSDGAPATRPATISPTAMATATDTAPATKNGHRRGGGSARDCGLDDWDGGTAGSLMGWVRQGCHHRTDRPVGRLGYSRVVDHRDHVGLIRDGVAGAGPSWADLGSGGGAFTLALADLLGPSGRIVSIDRDERPPRAGRELQSRFPAVALEMRVADFNRPLRLESSTGW